MVLVLKVCISSEKKRIVQNEIIKGNFRNEIFDDIESEILSILKNGSYRNFVLFEKRNKTH